MKWEFDAAGIAWTPHRERIAAVESALDELERLFAGDGYPERRGRAAPGELAVSRPAQRRGLGGTGPPVIIGGTGDRILALAARRADTVAVGGLMQAPGRPPGTFQLLNASQTDERIQFIRSQAGDRALELNVLVQMVVVTPDRRAAAAKLAADFGGSLDQDDVLQSPYLLLGTAAEIAAQLREQRERFGFSSITVHEPYMAAFAPVIEHVG